MSFALEDQLLIQCSRVKTNDEAIGIASNLLQQDLNWDHILEVSIRHGVSPLFYYGLNQVLQVVEDRCAGLFDNIEDILSVKEMTEMASAYKKTAGFV